MGTLTQRDSADMEPELAIVVAEVTKQITKTTLARTQQMSAKKAKKKAAKKPKKAKKAKKAKKPKKKKKKKAKKKKVRFPGGKRKKGQHKSKASVAAGKKSAAKLKAAGKGLFKVRTLSAALTAITGKSNMFKMNKALFKHVK